MGIKNRLHSPSSVSSQESSMKPLIFTSESPEQIDELEDGSHVGIDIWKQSIKVQTEDPVRLYPISSHPSPQLGNEKYNKGGKSMMNHNVNERSSLLPDANKKKKSSPSWWDKFVDSTNDQASVCSSSSSFSSDHDCQNPSIFSLRWPLHKRGKSQQPSHPYANEKEHSFYSSIGTRASKYSSYRDTTLHVSYILSALYIFHFFSMAVYDIIIPHNIWISKRGLLLNPLIGPSPLSLSKFGALNPARIVYNHEYWRIFTTMTLSCNLTHLVFNLLALHAIIIRVERQWGTGIIILIYLSSAFIASLVATTLRSSFVSTCASSGILALLCAALMEILLSNIRVSRFYRDRERSSCFPLFFPSKWNIKSKSNLIMLIILLNITVGLCPMVGFLPQIAGIISGSFLGFLYFVGPYLEDPTSFPGENKHSNIHFSSYAPPHMFGQSIDPTALYNPSQHLHDPFIPSPDSPVTRKSLILSPDDDDFEISPLSTNSTIRKKIGCCIPFLRAVSLVIVTVILFIPLYAIRMEYVQPSAYMQNPVLTNCQYMRRVVVESDDLFCQETCVPYAGVTHAAKTSGMMIGFCEEAGYYCFEGYIDDDTYKTSNDDVTMDSIMNIRQWSWNSEYKPIISAFVLPQNDGQCSNSNYHDEKNSNENNDIADNSNYANEDQNSENIESDEENYQEEDHNNQSSQHNYDQQENHGDEHESQDDKNEDQDGERDKDQVDE